MRVALSREFKLRRVQMRCVVASESSAWRSLSEVVGEVLVDIGSTPPAEDEMAAQAAAIRGIGRAIALPTSWQACGASEPKVSTRHRVTWFCVVMPARSACLPPPKLRRGGAVKPRNAIEEVSR